MATQIRLKAGENTEPPDARYVIDIVWITRSAVFAVAEDTQGLRHGEVMLGP